ncbi:MAG: dihydroneopterin aldolase [Marinobacter sp.]|uniref:dihydroneopterin aldolase n=1 Tax=Marinobacter sp. TaxID=50741 RepID=UPI00299D44ED|nr:dihydroneopterin aldolase [Marinobacter sp.]MDX1634446.1 dihydroneopterin aldolase [Marinobacter sp.]
MTDSVLIEQLAVEAIIGVFDWEREVHQRLLLDLEMAWANDRPAATDDLALALDYAAVCEAVTEWFHHHQPQLLETAAEAVAAELMQRFGIRWLAVTIRKPGVLPRAGSVGIRIERGQR